MECLDFESGNRADTMRMCGGGGGLGVSVRATVTSSWRGNTGSGKRLSNETAELVWSM